jgi:hypothetical protein
MVNSDHDKKYSSFNYITSVSFINGSEMMIAQCQMSNISAILWPEQVTSNEMMSVLY